MSQLKFPSAIPGLVPVNQGKTRDLFTARTKSGPHVDKKLLLIVATDRLSTHNIVHNSPIPFKGEVLTALTVYWLATVFPLAGINNHLVASGKKEIYDYLEGDLSAYPPDLHLKAIVVRKFEVVPIEFIYRNYLSGSLANSYYLKGLPNPYGHDLPPGMPLMAPFPKPLFTPTEKSETDDPLKAASVLGRYPAHCALAERSFLLTRNHLRSKGFEQVDGKFEVGTDEKGNPVMVDEISTPDSSRFCVRDSIRLGWEPPYLDKQVARDEAARIWGSDPKVPLVFSPDVVETLSKTYLRIFEKITDYSLKEFQNEFLS